MVREPIIVSIGCSQLWGPCSSLTAWRLYWTTLSSNRLWSLGRSGIRTSRGTGRVYWALEELGLAITWKVP